MIHGVCVAARVSGGVWAGDALQALAASTHALNPIINVNLLILNTSPSLANG